jgi:hypothetical protein
LTVVQPPVDTVANPGDTAKFSVKVQGRPRGAYQWYFGTAAIANATNSTLQIDNAQSDVAGSYYVVINNGVTNVQSTTAHLVMATEASPPAFTKIPSDLSLYTGQTFTFSAAASGVPQPSMQWQKDGQDLSGASFPDFTLSATSEADSGLYAVIAKNAVGSATNLFHVTVTAKPQLIITEVMSSSSTNAPGHQDWWELTNLGSFPVNLRGLRFDDNSETIAAAFTFTNDFTIAPNESIIFVESMTPDEFRNWWGPEYLPPNLQILPYKGNGLSSAGDAVNLWNAAASDDSDKLASAVFSTATPGVTFGYNPDTGKFGDLSVDGANGAFTAASGGDIGSPGYIRNSQRVILPRLREISVSGGNLHLSWSTQSGTQYAVQSKSQLTDASWTSEKTVTASDSVTAIDLPFSTAGQRFYRVQQTP